VASALERGQSGIIKKREVPDGIGRQLADVRLIYEAATRPGKCDLSSAFWTDGSVAVSLFWYGEGTSTPFAIEVDAHWASLLAEQELELALRLRLADRCNVRLQQAA
jgi:hypothetical protein